MTQYIKRLPTVFQTVTEKKFFDATFDQVFSKKDSDLLSGYLGRRDPGSYNPITDFYLPEPTKDRTWWQLEATAYARDTDTTKSNIFFYEDLLNKIKYYGGNVLNQDRLFESEYYSFGPPIDYDMFINYQNYYWIEQGLPVINISGVMASDIIGQASYTTPALADPPNFTLSTGMSISLLDDVDYIEPHVVENFGGCTGIGLVQKFSDLTAGTIFEFLPWDGSIELSTGRTIHNEYWDATTWEVQAQPGNGDYITIERGALDRNAWSRTNKWFHIDTINQALIQTGTSFPANATRALRPIIQFIADIPLYKAGTQFRDTINYGFRDNSVGIPLTLADFQSQQLTVINSTYSIEIADKDLVCWFNDVASNTYIYEANLQGDGSVIFTEYTSVATPVLEGDIVFIAEDSPYDGAQAGTTWYYADSQWQEVNNEKVSTNQPPLFLLYDHNNVPLDDTATYPDSTFHGSKIFSYKINTTPGATVDPVLKFPIVYSSLGQSTDIIFQNNLITDRYTYTSALTPISGYYYYNTTTSPVLFNNWNLYDICDCDDIIPPPPCNCIEVSKQRVIDKFVVGYGSEYQFRLSVTPYGYPSSPDIIVSVNGTEVLSSADQIDGYTFVEINNRIFVDLTTYLTTLLLTTQGQPPVVEVQTYTHGLLDPSEPGYFEIPQQLEANPTQEEISEITGSNLVQQFSSIISNQIGFNGIAFGGINNYRDSRKNRSVGSYILQNLAPALKSMLVSSSDDLDFIPAARFSSDEYTKFKNKFLSTALQLINQGFSPVQVYNNSVNISSWVGEIFKILNVSKEFSNAFAYSFMAASGTPYSSEIHTVPGNSSFTLTNYVDLNNPRNVMYIYDVTDPNNVTLLIVDQDYEITSTNLSIDVQMNLSAGVKSFNVYLYQNPIPTYIPSTPTKLGMYGAYIPRIELDTTYAIPTNVVIGHDGSKTIAYGDYRDQLLLNLETRIYNSIPQKFRNEYYLPIRLESIKSGYFRETRYTRDEFLEVTESYLNKWSAKNKANYRVNDWPTASLTTPVNQLWKLYNYRLAVTPTGAATDLPGNWKGIFQYYYDTYYPDTRPWEMLGFSEQPSWWQFEYGAPVLNLVGQEVWASTASGNNVLYNDLEAGIIRQGPSAIFDPETLLPQPQEMWARPGLSSLIPVDASGEIIPIITLFGLAYTGNPYEPFDHFDDPWIYGDGSPVEQAWMSTSGYRYSIQEFLYLMKPGPFGELFWDTLGTELSPGQLTIPGIISPVMSNKNWQYVQNEVFSYNDEFFSWFRPKNADQIVHAEIVDGVTEVRFGYQTWVSDRILFLGKDIADTFGQKIRTLDVNLANKLAGFINKDTTNTYISSITPGATTNTLIIPSTNFEVFLHKSPVVDTYSYSGIIIRSLADGTFVVYGYDLLNSEFITLDRSTSKLIDVTVGGTPAEFRHFENGGTYQQGEYVRYNGVYYVSEATQTVQTFGQGSWQKLKGLPTVGGISVTYKPYSAETTTRYPYGSILKNPQEVFDLMIGWGAYLESQGWQFNDVNQDTNIINDWLSSAKQFLFWLNTNWAPDASIQLSPLANSATLIVKRGYPNDVETLSNGVYSILDKYGVAIAPNNTTTDREGPSITVAPANLAAGGIYYLQVNVSETEHVLIFDNETSFSDVIYSPLLRARQQRLRFYGFRSNGWYGKMEAPGYLVIDDQLVPNYDSIVDAMRYYYDPNVTIDNPSLEDLGRHLIGYESKSYLDNLEVADDVQYLFYQGAIRQKGTKQAFEKLFRSTKVQGDEIIKVYEEWALKLGDFGNTIEQVSTEFKLKPEQNTGEVIVARLNFVPSEIGFVKQVNILNAQNTYVNIPRLIFPLPDATPNVVWTNWSDLGEYQVGSVVQYPDIYGNPVYYSSKIIQGPTPVFNNADWTVILATRVTKAYVVLDSSNRISRIDITDPGYGYLSAPSVTIDSGTESHALDKLYTVWQGEIISDPTLDNIINIDIDETDIWTVRPPDPSVSLEFPLTDVVDYPLPNAGYVHFNDVDLSSFDVEQTAARWGTTNFNPLADDTLWVAKTFTEDWGVFKITDISGPSDFDVVTNVDGQLFLRTPAGYKITPQFGGNIDLMKETDFGNLLSLYVNEAHATAIIDNGETNINATASVSIIHAATATASDPTTPLTPFGEIQFINIIDPGAGYTFTPSVVIDPPLSGETATAVATITDGVITSIDIVNPGNGYTSVPLVTIEDPYNIGEISSINVINSGNGYTSAPSVIIAGDGAGATATSQIIDGQVTGFTITNSGSGYTFATATIGSSPLALGEITEIIVTKSGSNYISAPIVTISGDGAGATATAIIAGGVVSEITITNPGSGYTSVSVDITPPLSIGADTNYIVAFEFNQVETDNDPTYNYYNLVTLNGTPITSTDIPEYISFTNLNLFKTMRFLLSDDLLPVPITTTYPYISIGDKIWSDGFNPTATTPPVWNVFTVVTPSIQYPTGRQPFRTQEPLINTALFESASVFNATGTELVQLPIYDPFKYILPGPAKQNLTYIALQDPATYNVTGNEALFDENITFGENQVGQLWWDTSDTRFVYYEQPIALDGSESELDNLVYRRDHWAQLFPGSTVAIYEWTKSPVPPAQYTGTGTPRDVTSYVQITTSNRFTSITETNYYFWVLGATDLPNIENRTLAALNVASLLQTPKSQGFAFFAPIQQTDTNNSYMFYNVQEILAYQGDNVQVQYRISERDDQEHTQWSFFREGDPNSLVTDQFWNKMVDSLCGYTKVLPITGEYSNGIVIANYLPWDIYGWDVALWDDATALTTPEYGEILPVPDPTLSEEEKYGIQYRPRQGMFVNLQAARKIFVQSSNDLLKHIPIRDNNPSWNADVSTSDYWAYTNWYEVGYEDAVPTVVYSTLAEANAALLAGELLLGTILQVTDGTVDGRYVLYVVVQLNPNIPVLSLNEIGIQDSAIMLLNTVHTTSNRYGLSVEIRELLNAFRTQVMVDAFIVDQNELFFSMLNYVVSEQKTPDWVFKTSYIFIKEDNIPLSQSQLYIPDQINNIIDYITDVKPYHTQIRDYSTTYTTTDIAPGTATDFVNWAITLQFGPNGTGYWDTDVWDNYPWDNYEQPFPYYILNADSFYNNIQQFISQEDVYTVPLTFFDVSKVGYSQLYPYTFDFSSINLNDPQTFITPEEIVGVQIGNEILIAGQDYYAEYNSDDDNYTIYFFDDPGNSPTPVALVWFDGGSLLNVNFNGYRNELAIGTSTDDIVINVDTKLPVLEYGGDLYPMANGWDYAATEPLQTILANNGVNATIPWDALPFDVADINELIDDGATIEILEETMSSKMNVNQLDGANFYRNALVYAGNLIEDLPAPTADTYNLDSIVVYVDPVTHPLTTDILPYPGVNPGVIWIDGERIEYKLKTITAANTWTLQQIRRGTMGTGVTDHLASVPEVDEVNTGPNGETILVDPPVYVPNQVWVENANVMPLPSNDDVWNANSLPATPDNETTYDAWAASPVPNPNYTISDQRLYEVAYQPGTRVEYLGQIYQSLKLVLWADNQTFNTDFWYLVVDPVVYTSITDVPIGGLWYANTPERDFLIADLGKSIP